MYSNFIKVISNFIYSFLKNKNIKSYALFFLIAFSFWFLTMLSKTHETTYLFPVDYVNSPADLISLAPPVNFISVRVKASGISILSFYIFNNRRSLILNYDVSNSQPTSNGKDIFWIMNSKRNELSGFFGATTEIMDITPQRILVPFVYKNKKEVPIILNSDISLKQAFWLSNDIKLNYETVYIYGEKNLLDSIHSITTELLKLDNLDEDQKHEIGLDIPVGVQCQVESVLVEINIEPFIEDKITTQVKIRNLAEGYSMKIFPSNVSVTLRFPKDKFQLSKTDFLRLYVDILGKTTLSAVNACIPPEAIVPPFARKLGNLVNPVLLITSSAVP